jgi:hypothetical protein
MQVFLEFINFYRRFIKNFFRVTRPLIQLTKKDKSFEWTLACQRAFDELKKRITQVLILAHFDFELKTIVEIDSSNYVFAKVLSQRDKNEIIKSVAFFFKSLLSAECNYEIYDKELLAIVKCFEQWRPELQSVNKPVNVLTDHKSLEYFMTIKKLNRRQVRWVEYLTDFNFVITYQAGKIHANADALWGSGTNPIIYFQTKISNQRRKTILQWVPP